ncbi:MAG: ATP-dependent protease subunit HslV [Spirochaetota bacterium]
MFRSTTICAVRRDTRVAVAGDGQVTMGNTVVKNGAVKIRKLHKGAVVSGFAGATADAFTLFEKFEGKLEEYNGDITRSAVELARDWRTDRMLRRLEALLLVANREKILLISGSGDVIEPDDDVLTIGSGGMYAKAAAVALLGHTTLSAEEIAKRSLEIASEICIYTNKNITVEVLS